MVISTTESDKIIKLYSDLKRKKISIDDLEEEKLLINNIAKKLIDGYINKIMLENTIRLCLNYYTYSSKGDVLVVDKMYDDLMNLWKAMGEKTIIYPDVIELPYTTWPMKKHDDVGMVGSIGKIYTDDELEKFILKYRGVSKWTISPKFDGISLSIETGNGISNGLTRGDGFEGQDVSPILKYVNIDSTPFMYNKIREIVGKVKCEVVMSTQDFNLLNEEKEYSNRRSATSGIVNTPSNIHLAKYLTLLPLYFRGDNEELYSPLHSTTIVVPADDIRKTIKEIKKEMTKMLNEIRHADYPYRTDGIILYPHDDHSNVNPNDYMENAIAFKVNTNEANTTVDYGYVSIGRLGKATPMLRVHPVEVNETVVSDVSLGSFDKFAMLDIHENETVTVYSAGDVIPQVKLPDNREYRVGSDYIKIKKRCPHCETKLERFGLVYKCTNEKCPRVASGKIANFISKLGVKDISDGIIQSLYDNKVINGLEDIFRIEYDDIVKIPGFHEVSSTNIINELTRIKKTKIPISVFFGALGIPNISEKKCRNIFNYITIDDVINKPIKKMRPKILDIDNIGIKTAEVFMEYVEENREMIKELFYTLNVVSNISYKGNVVFTNFRNPDLEKRFNDISIEVSNSINSKTLALISGTYDHTTTKAKEAIRRGIDIVDLIDVESLIKILDK